MSIDSGIEAAVDVNGDRHGLVELLGLDVHPQAKWLAEVTSRCLRGDELCSAQPFLVRAIVRALERDQTRWSAWRSIADDYVAVLRWLADLSASEHLSPQYGRVGRGPASSGAVQTRIRAAIVEAMPSLEILFHAYGRTGKRAAGLVAVAARAGRQLHSDASLRHELINCKSGHEAHDLAIATSRISVDDEWAAWLYSVLHDAAATSSISPPRAILALLSWCMLTEARFAVDPIEAKCIARISGMSSIHRPLILGLFDQRAAALVKIEIIGVCESAVVALDYVLEILIALFDPYLCVLGQSSSAEQSLVYQLSGRPPKIEFAVLSSQQRYALLAITDSPRVYERTTNLWVLWDLPSTSIGLKQRVQGG